MNTAGGLMPMPTAVVDHRASGVLELTWADGATSRLPHAVLRSRCRCSGCEQARRHGVETDPADPVVRLSELLPLSDKGVNHHFNDGHGRGIYPWDYLRALGDALSVA
jgi:DUF971 family protein